MVMRWKRTGFSGKSPAKTGACLIGVSRILIIASCGIGDLVLATPFIANIRHSFPGARLTLVQRPDLPDGIGGMLQGVDDVVVFPTSYLVSFFNKSMPCADAASVCKGLFKELLFAARLRFSCFDMSFALFPGGLGGEQWWHRLIGAKIRVGPETFTENKKRKSGYTHTVRWDDTRHAVANNLDLLRSLEITPKSMPLALALQKSHCDEADSFLKNAGFRADRDVAVGMHPGGLSASKPYWPAERFAAVARYLVKKRGIWVVVFAGPGEERMFEHFGNLPVIWAYGLAFPVTCAVIRRCGIIFTSDTGLGHVAAAQRVPTLTIYATNLHKYRHWGNADIAINTLDSCEYPGIAERYSADERGKKAMLRVSVEDVTREFDRLIGFIPVPGGGTTGDSSDEKRNGPRRGMTGL
jgi:ADP-heptose:LPS heptosyltransferase